MAAWIDEWMVVVVVLILLLVLGHANNRVCLNRMTHSYIYKPPARPQTTTYRQTPPWNCAWDRTDKRLVRSSPRPRCSSARRPGTGDTSAETSSFRRSAIAQVPGSPGSECNSDTPPRPCPWPGTSSRPRPASTRTGVVALTNQSGSGCTPCSCVFGGRENRKES